MPSNGFVDDHTDVSMYLMQGSSRLTYRRSEGAG
jgi:hypothetical protein